MAAQSGLDSGQLIAMAFRDLADNAEKVGTLNISPELLQSLLGATENAGSDAAATRRRRRDD